MERLDKHSIKIAVLCLSWICTLSFISCSEDEVVNQTSNTSSENISFGIKKETESRSLESYPSQYFVLHNEDGTDSLYLKASVTEGIDLSTEDLISRGALVTAGSNINQFGVMAYKENTTTPWFNETATQTTSNGQTVWETTTTHYWPNEGQTLDFYSYYPSASTTINVGTNKTLTASYTIPSTVTDQMDAMVAINEGIVDNYYQAVGVSFKHLCTAIKFKFADVMEAEGNVTKIAISGVLGGTVSYTYNRNNQSWEVTTPPTTTTNYELSFNKSSNDSDKNITTDDNLFLLAPQTLPSGAKITITFGGVNYEASISGEWLIGQTTTYTINITPSYELTFTTEQAAIPTKDCHYEIQQLTISPEKFGDSWSVESDADWATVRIMTTEDSEEAANDMYWQGYWTEQEKGSSSITGQTTNEPTSILVYFYENTGDEDREATITLYANKNGVRTAVDQRTIKQYCPLWNNGKAYERIEESSSQYPWGFDWTNTKIVYKNNSDGWIINGLRYIIWGILKNWFGRYDDYVSMTYNWNTLTGTIDLSQIPDLDTATSTDDGTTNTYQLYTFEGVNVITQAAGIFESWGLTYSSGAPENVMHFAARMITYKNKFNKVNKGSSSGQTGYVAELTSDGIQWYIPAKNEISALKDTACDDESSNNDQPLSGSYWTSTAATYTENGNEVLAAYYYDAADSSTDKKAPRTKEKKIRAARIKP